MHRGNIIFNDMAASISIVLTSARRLLYLTIEKMQMWFIFPRMAFKEYKCNCNNVLVDGNIPREKRGYTALCL